MYRKLTLIIVAATMFAVLLIFKPWELLFSEDQTPSFYDRLPVSDNIGRSDILSLSTTFSKTLYHYQSPLREFLSPEFLLSQGKNYGLDFQSSVYFFADDKDSKYFTDLGIMVMVLDSSKIGEGIQRFSNMMSFKDTTMFSQRVFAYRGRDMYITYGSDWFLFYNGKNFEGRLRSILKAKKNDIPAEWRTFLNNYNLTRHNVVMRSFSPKLQSRGIQQATFTAQNDSTTIIISAIMEPFDSVSFQIRSGYQLKEKEFTKRLVNLHLDVSKVKRNSRDPIYAILSELGKKVSFPVDAFLDTWSGDLAFRNGGTYLLKEEYIESELDEDFNITEKVKIKEVKISGVSAYLSVSEKNRPFIRSLYNKGIITEDGDRVRVLFSPPLNLRSSDSSLLVYSSNYKPELHEGSVNMGIWPVSKTPVTFYLDSTSAHSIYGRIQFPADELLQQKID